MRFWTTRSRYGSALLLAAVLGCDGFGSAPPGPPPAAPVTETPKVALILPADGVSELEIWEATARREQVRTVTLTDIRKLSPGDPPEKQVELIRAAVADGCSALIVLAADPKVVAPVLEELRAEGLPIVLLDREVPLSGDPLTRVTYASPRETARQLVDISVLRAREAGFPDEGPAMILTDAGGDSHTQARVKALREELQSRGIRVLPDATYFGIGAEATKALEMALPAAPHVAMVFAENDFALRAASTFRHRLDRTQRRFVLAGYSHARQTMDLVNYNVVAGIVDRNLNEIIHQAFDTALALARGETVPLLVESPTPLNRSTGKEKEGVYPPFLSVPEMMEKSGKTEEPMTRVPDNNVDS